jgi:hypothetical protein
MTAQDELAQRAAAAIERVCARGDFEAAPRYYSPRFLDHVNGLEYEGLEGVRQSVGLYRLVLPDLRMTVEEQVVDGDRVVSRWRAEGTNLGRRVRLWGITTSRFEDGLIVEDWSASDNLGLVRQLGPWRVALLGLRFARSTPPPLLSSWPRPMQVFLAGILPASFGFLCGAVLGASGAVFLALQVLAAAGGYLGGMEHARPRSGTLRGVWGGLVFGGFLLVGHEVVGGDDHDLLPDPEVLQLLITVGVGTLLGTLGARARARRTGPVPA